MHNGIFDGALTVGAIGGESYCEFSNPVASTLKPFSNPHSYCVFSYLSYPLGDRTCPTRRRSRYLVVVFFLLETCHRCIVVLIVPTGSLQTKTNILNGNIIPKLNSCPETPADRMCPVTEGAPFSPTNILVLLRIECTFGFHLSSDCHFATFIIFWPSLTFQKCISIILAFFANIQPKICNHPCCAIGMRV